MNPQEIVFIVALAIGALLRTFAPYIRKCVEGSLEWGDFEYKYLAIFLVSYLVAIIVALQLFILTPLPEGNDLTVFAVGLLTGWGSTGLVNEVRKVFLPDPS